MKNGDVCSRENPKNSKNEKKKKNKSRNNLLKKIQSGDNKKRIVQLVLWDHVPLLGRLKK